MSDTTNTPSQSDTPPPATSPKEMSPLLTFAFAQKDAVKPNLNDAIIEDATKRRSAAVTELAGIVCKAADKALLLNNRIKGIRPKPIGIDTTTLKPVEGTLLSLEQGKELKQLKDDMDKGEKAYAKAMSGDFEELKKWASTPAQGKDAPVTAPTDSDSAA
jgi:hypothetical protein